MTLDKLRKKYEKATNKLLHQVSFRFMNNPPQPITAPQEIIDEFSEKGQDIWISGYNIGYSDGVDKEAYWDGYDEGRRDGEDEGFTRGEISGRQQANEINEMFETSPYR